MIGITMSGSVGKRNKGSLWAQAKKSNHSNKMATTVFMF